MSAILHAPPPLVGAPLHRVVRAALLAMLAAGAVACGAADAVSPRDAELPIDVNGTAPGGGAAGAPATGALGAYTLFANAGSPALRQAELWRASRPADADLMAWMGAQPTARWLNEWTGDVTASVRTTLDAAQGHLPVFVAYNIPHRDCGSHSAGGASAADAYRGWIRRFADGLLGRRAVVILEPDAIAGAGCLGAELQEERFALLRHAVDVLSAAGGMVYLDAGHPGWLGADEAAARLTRAGIAHAQGFSLNVSNFVATQDNVAYGDRVSALVGGKRYVIDTSRNGRGAAPGGAWCNPDGRALGALPTTRPAWPLVDALLWIKVPGESDGACNGGPAAGTWWPEYALELARNRPL